MKHKSGPGMPSHIHIFLTNKEKIKKTCIMNFKKKKRANLMFLYIAGKSFIFNNKVWNKIFKILFKQLMSQKYNGYVYNFKFYMK